MDNDLLRTNLQIRLQEALTEGFHLLVSNSLFGNLSDYFEWLNQAGLYESKFRGLFPNPAYDFGARVIGRPFLRVLFDLGASLEHEFPGNFDQSMERCHEGEAEVRVFSNKIRVEQLSVSIKLSFPHLHDKYEFTSSPILSIVEEF